MLGRMEEQRTSQNHEESKHLTFSSSRAGLGVLPAAALAAAPAAIAASKEAGACCVYMASSTPSAARRSSGPSYSTVICVGEGVCTGTGR